MKHLLLIIFLLTSTFHIFSQVKHSTDASGNTKIHITIPGHIKDYSLREYIPRFDLKFYSTQNGFGSRLDYERAKFYYYTDGTSFVFITKSAKENIGTYRMLINSNWKNFDIENDKIEEHAPKEFECTTPDIGESVITDGAPSLKCAKLYTEWDYDFFTQAGSLSNAISRIQAILAQSQWIYDRDSINAKYNEVYIWTTPDPYTGTSSTQQLSLFKQYHKPFTDNLAQLCEINPYAIGGIANGVATFCSSYNFSYSDIYYSYNNVPSYSWTINVITHEFGHLLGSRHTHWCGWMDNGIVIGALDNCGPLAGYPTEGGCVPGPTPINGGTIMSYCHLLSYGINFNNGFGYYPRRAIWTAINNSACLSYCDTTLPPPPPTTCNDAQEPNNTIENAFGISKNNSYIAGLDVTGDIDWYRINTTRNNTNIKISFSNLSHSTVVELYQNNTLVKSLTGSGSQTLIHNSNVIGTYYVKAYPASGTLSGCYNLNLMLQKKQFTGNYADIDGSSYNLEQNYPNPFNASTKISYKIPEDESFARIVVYDILGKELINTSLQNADGYVILDLTSENFASGLYFYKLVTSRFASEFKKMVLIK